MYKSRPYSDRSDKTDALIRRGTGGRELSHPLQRHAHAHTEKKGQSGQSAEARRAFARNQVGLNLNLEL